ncbi:MAG: hypothetical protein QMC36_05935 [Patescibacteria group bacterium]
MVRTADGAAIGTFAQNLTCSAVAVSVSATPDVDEDCNGQWDNTVLVASLGSNRCVYWEHFPGVSDCS